MRLLPRLLPLHVGLPLHAPRQGLGVQDWRRIFQLGFQRQRSDLPQVPQDSGELSALPWHEGEDLQHMRRYRPDVPGRRQELAVATPDGNIPVS